MTFTLPADAPLRSTAAQRADGVPEHWRPAFEPSLGNVHLGTGRSYSVLADHLYSMAVTMQCVSHGMEEKLRACTSSATLQKLESQGVTQKAYFP